MAIHYLNCFTCNARFPRHWRSGALCLLVESNDGLVLVDTGLGTRDYRAAPGILRLFKLVTIVPMNPGETALCQVTRLGYRQEDVRHIVLTHLHFDHAGGLPDFPQAKIHVHRRELEALHSGKIRRWTDGGYNWHILDHKPDFVLYEGTGEKWYDFDAIRLPFEPAMWLLPLFGHTAGHCGVAIQDGGGWLFHVGDAASFASDAPEWAVKVVLGTHQPRLRAFEKAHPEVRLTTGHMDLAFFSTRVVKMGLIETAGR
jgi:glyoxylase-like metal-dependent hydrolase (beta-lactamase superfamily II)